MYPETFTEATMVRLTCALLLLGVAVCSASESRIVGGIPVPIARHPSVVQVQSMWFPKRWTQLCAGAILNSRYMVGAARCFRGAYYTPRFRQVIAGSTYRNTGGVTVGVERVTNHPSFSEAIGYDGDITVVRFASPLTYSLFIQRAAVLAQGVKVADNTRVVQVGWGVTLEEFPDIRATQLHEVTVQTVNNAQCAENYRNFIIPRTVTENMICAGNPEGGAGACYGDTGGPLFVNNIVAGIVSWGWGCRNATFPRVHTAVSSYTNWLIENAS